MRRKPERKFWRTCDEGSHKRRKEKGQQDNEVLPRNPSVNLNSVLEKSVEEDYSCAEGGMKELVTVVSQ